MIADDVVTLIEAAGLGEDGEDLMAGGLPPSPDTVTVVQESAGIRPSSVFGQALPAIEYPRVQILTRGAPGDYEAPRLRIERVYQLLLSRPAEVVTGGARYLRWEPVQTPFPLIQDDNLRWMFVVNFEAWKEMSTLP